MIIQKILGQLAEILFGPSHSDVSHSQEPQFVAIKARKMEDTRVTHSTAA
jgi:hypothetical protein